MPRSWLRPVRQVHDSDTYDDTLVPNPNFETTGPDQEWDLNTLRSMVKRIIHGAAAGNWFDDPATVFGGDASLKALFASLGTADKVISAAGQFSVPIAVSVNDLIYASGAFTGNQADNSSITSAPAMGIVIAKPTTITATVAFFGIVGGFAGMTVGANQYLGVTGGLVEPPLPTAVGTVIQKVGQALNSTTLLFDPDLPIIL